MIEIARHIEVLLLENDCVIIPDFGGFTAHHIDARYDASDASFIPPLRTLGFNPQLRMNDSLLIHSYAECYNLSYPDAQQRVNAEVNELWNTLRECGFYDLNNIGTLSLNESGNIEFVPNEAGILTPEYYGLSSFEMRQLAPESKEQHAVEQVVTEANSQEAEENKYSVLAIDESADDEGKTISIRVAWIRNAVAIAAAIIAYFLITTPVSTNFPSQTGLASMQPVLTNNSESQLQADTTRVAATEAVTDTMNVKATEEAKDTTATTPVVQQQKKTYYVVVLASQTSMANAQNFVQLLHKQGYASARVHTKNKVNRVVYGHYANERDAYQMVNKFRDHEEYDLAWVMKIEE